MTSITSPRITSIDRFDQIDRHLYTSNVDRQDLSSNSAKNMSQILNGIGQIFNGLGIGGEGFWQLYDSFCYQNKGNVVLGQLAFESSVSTDLGCFSVLAQDMMAVSCGYNQLSVENQESLQNNEAWPLKILQTATKELLKIIPRVVKEQNQKNHGKAKLIKCSATPTCRKIFLGQRAYESDWEIVQRVYKLDSPALDVLKREAEELASATDNGRIVVTTDDIALALENLGYDASKVLPKQKTKTKNDSKNQDKRERETRTETNPETNPETDTFAAEFIAADLEQERSRIDALDRQNQQKDNIIEEQLALIEFLTEQLNSRQTATEAQNTNLSADSPTTNHNDFDLIITIADISVEDVAPTVPQESAAIVDEDVAIASQREFVVEVEDSVATVEEVRTSDARTTSDNDNKEPRTTIELTALPPIVVGVAESVDLTGKCVRMCDSGEKGRVIGRDGDNWQISLASTCMPTLVSFHEDDLELLPKPIPLMSELVNTQPTRKRRTRVLEEFQVTSEPRRIRSRHKPQGFGTVA